MKYKNNYVYKETFPSGKSYYGSYQNGKFYIELPLEKMNPLSTIIWSMSRAELDDNFLNTGNSVNEEVGILQPLWKIIFTFGFCGCWRKI